jgi:hypothetical protein
MSQQIVLQLLQELGGIATSSEIIRLAREKYPDLSLWQYVGDRLRNKQEVFHCTRETTSSYRYRTVVIGSWRGLNRTDLIMQ